MGAVPPASRCRRRPGSAVVATVGGSGIDGLTVHSLLQAPRIVGVGSGNQIVAAATGIGSKTRRGREPRLDDLHPNAKHTELVSQRFREALDRMLGGRMYASLFSRRHTTIVVFFTLPCLATIKS